MGGQKPQNQEGKIGVFETQDPGLVTPRHRNWVTTFLLDTWGVRVA